MFRLWGSLKHCYRNEKKNHYFHRLFALQQLARSFDPRVVSLFVRPIATANRTEHNIIYNFGPRTHKFQIITITRER